MKYNRSHKTRDVKADFVNGKPIFREAINDWRQLSDDGVVEAESIEQYFENASLNGMGYVVQPDGTYKKISISTSMGFIEHEYIVFKME